MNADFKNLPDAVASAVVGLLSPHTGVKTVKELGVLLSKGEEGDKIYTQHDVENQFKVSYWTLRRAEKAGKLKVLRAGKKRLYRQSDIEKYLLGE